MPAGQEVGGRGLVIGSLIHHHDLIGRIREQQQMPDGVAEDLFAAVGGDDDTEVQGGYPGITRKTRSAYESQE